MHRIILSAMVASAVLAVPVASATERMNDVEYLRAVRCLAYVAGAESRVIDAESLAEEVGAQGHNRERYIRERARREGRFILRQGERLENDRARDGYERDLRAACDGLEPMIAGLDPRA